MRAEAVDSCCISQCAPLGVHRGTARQERGQRTWRGTRTETELETTPVVARHRSIKFNSFLMQALGKEAGDTRQEAGGRRAARVGWVATFALELQLQLTSGDN